MATLQAAYRGSTAAPAGSRPDLPLPPGRMPALRAGRVLKRWRYVGVYGPELMICVGRVRIGPAGQSFWAIWDRGAGRLLERTTRRAGGMTMAPGRVDVRAPGVTIAIAFQEGDGVETVTPYDGAYAWTAKQAPLPAHVVVEIDGKRRELEALALIDDSAGYHPRRVSWRWCAGVGADEQGAPLAWNLVTGIHDSATESERTIWVAGTPSEVGPVTFAADLSSVAFAEGAVLDFAAEAERAKEDALPPFFRSSYVQPFGTFGGTLPGGVRVAEGFGVMERHEVLW